MAKRLPTSIYAVFISVTVILGLIWLVLFLTRSPIPSDIRRQATFQLFYPSSDVASVKVDTATIAFDKSNSVFTYAVEVQNHSVTITEQATPASFSDGPVYSYLLQKSHQFDTVKTNLGDLALTRPDELMGKEVGIINPNGTLIFAKPKENLSTSGWKLLLNSLEKVK